jgi:hypothetical protein
MRASSLAAGIGAVAFGVLTLVAGLAALAAPAWFPF